MRAARADVFLSHACASNSLHFYFGPGDVFQCALRALLGDLTGEDRPFASEVCHDLGKGGLQLKVYQDLDSCQPGLVGATVHIGRAM